TYSSTTQHHLHRYLPSFPTRRSSDLVFGFESHTRAEKIEKSRTVEGHDSHTMLDGFNLHSPIPSMSAGMKVAIVHKRLDRDTKRSEEHTSELQSRFDLVCRLLLEKKK